MRERFRELGFILFVFLSVCSAGARAGTEGSISGTVVGADGVNVSGAKVILLDSEGKQLNETRSSLVGTFQFFPVVFGDYVLAVEAAGYPSQREAVHVANDVATNVSVSLSREGGEAGKEMVLHVRAKKRVQDPAPTSAIEISKETVEKGPLGNSISLPQLITSTSPGVVQGAFGQMFFRGNHANIQYQIDGVQVPDSATNEFGEAISPRNIDHMELITGGIPAEYGQRLSAVMNIVTKSGPQEAGGSAELNYGSFNTFAPNANYGGSLGDGNIHYYLSAKYSQTDRGLDTPQPASDTNQGSGGTDAIHDQAHANDEFAKFDWVIDNSNKIILVGFHEYNFFQIPNYPQSFGPTDPIFQQGFTDQFGNPQYNYVPYNTNDSQAERNALAQLVWKHTFSENANLQIAPYWKYSSVVVSNDPTNDLAALTGIDNGAPIPGASPTSFAENRQTNNLGVKTDYTWRINDQHLMKTGFQLQASQSTGSFSVQTQPNQVPYSDSSPDTGYFGGAYVQDDYTISKKWSVNAGLRVDGTEFQFSGLTTNDWALQPRIGLTYLPTETTKLHAFYGRLFQPAPVENLRDAFSQTNLGTCPPGQLCPYDIKAEKDNYYEVGVSQIVAPVDQTVTVNVYYKDATNMLDDTELGTTSIAQPYNFASGFAYGVETSVKGHITDEISDYLNYSYEIAKGAGISGGIFAFNGADSLPPGTYQFLDHVQVNTLNAGATWAHSSYWVTAEALFGSGLRTGNNNSISLPDHLTFNLTVGYDFQKLSDSWWAKTKLSVDALNLTNNPYPISVANGFNGSHYAAPLEIFARIEKEI